MKLLLLIVANYSPSIVFSQKFILYISYVLNVADSVGLLEKLITRIMSSL